MRKKIVAGNWKMNMSLEEGITLAKEINALIAGMNDRSTGVILGVPFIHLSGVVNTVDTGRIDVAAQNCAAWESGAYTGEISAGMIKSTGAKYVILGHSERRKYFKEAGDVLKTKVQLALHNGLKPIFCIGELLEERNSKRHFKVVEQQLSGSLFHLDATEFENIVLAYEPVWAIGTGVTATAGQAQEMHGFIRQLLESHYGSGLANRTTILYGGSCKPSNAGELFANPDVDGGLIGGASLKAEDFLGIIICLE